MGPTYDNFIKQVTAAIEAESAAGLDDQARAHIYIINRIFVVKALENDQKLLAQIIEKYHELPTKLKESLIQPLIDIKGNQVLDEINKGRFKNFDFSEHSHTYVDSRDFIVKNNDEFGVNDLKYNSDLTDYLWSAFYATGDDKYLLKIVDFTNSWPDSFKKIAQEMVDRSKIATILHNIGLELDEDEKYRDLLAKSEQECRVNIYQLKSLYKVLWSLESNKKQYPQLDQIMNTIN